VAEKGVVNVDVVAIFCRVKVVVDRGDDLLGGLVDLLPFPFRKLGHNLQALGDASSPKPNNINYRSRPLVDN